MFKLVLLIGLISITYAVPIAKDEIATLTKAMPCRNREVGGRLRHPTDDHKFLRCVSADSFWIETCPDNLFYNADLDLCDWTVKSETTTAVNDIVKFRPVLFKANKTIVETAKPIVDKSKLPVRVVSSRPFSMHVNSNSNINNRVVAKPVVPSFNVKPIKPVPVINNANDKFQANIDDNSEEVVNDEQIDEQERDMAKDQVVGHNEEEIEETTTTTTTARPFVAVNTHSAFNPVITTTTTATAIPTTTVMPTVAARNFVGTNMGTNFGNTGFNRFKQPFFGGNFGTQFNTVAGTRNF